MRKVKYFIFTLVCMLVIPTISNAECDYQRQAELARKASNVQLSYNYSVTSGLQFTLYVTNLTDDLYMVDSYDNYFTGGDERSFVYASSTVSGFNNKDKITFTIYANDDECHGVKLLNKYITFPSFNPYSYNEECKSNPNFVYCQTWLDTSNLDYDQFAAALKQYNDDVKKIDNNAIKKDTIYDQILNFIQQPYIIVTFIILIIFILLGMGLIFIQKRKNKR